MLRFAARHFTAILIVLAVAAWGLFYLPGTPTWAVLQMKRAVDARDGAGAAQYVDFESVVKHAGEEIIQKQAGTNPLGQLLAKTALGVFIKPMAQAAQAWAVKQVNDGAREVQMPAAAVAGSLVVLHKSGNLAYTDFKDNKGREWEIQMTRGDDGRWRVSEVKDIEQLLQKLKREDQKNPGAP